MMKRSKSAVSANVTTTVGYWARTAQYWNAPLSPAYPPPNQVRCTLIPDPGMRRSTSALAATGWATAMAQSAMAMSPGLALPTTTDLNHGSTAADRSANAGAIACQRIVKLLETRRRQRRILTTSMLWPRGEPRLGLGRFAPVRTLPDSGKARLPARSDRSGRRHQCVA